MFVKTEIWTFQDLEKLCWSGAKQTLEKIAEKDLEDEFLSLLEDIFSDGIPSETDVNDFIWFETDVIEEYLGVKLWED